MLPFALPTHLFKNLTYPKITFADATNAGFFYSVNQTVFCMKNLSTLFCLLLLFAATGHAQTYKMQSNNVKAAISSNGTLFANGQFIPIQADLPEKNLLNGSGLWFAGIDPEGNLRGAINRLGSTDFQPGALSTKAQGPASNLNNIWAVKCSDIADHLSDYSDNAMIDQPLPSVFGFPCQGNTFFEQYNLDGSTLNAVKQGLCGFSDIDGNGLFDPDRGEFPALEIRGCPIGFPVTEMAYTIFNDKLETPHPSGMLAMGLEVQTQTFQLNVSPLENTVFVRYKLVYKGIIPLDSCYAGIYIDFAIGNEADDYIGSSPEFQLMYAYNGDEQDEGGFEDKTPAIGVTVLRRPVITTPDDNIVELDVQSALSVEDPTALSPAQLYSILTGHLPDGSPAPGGSFSFPGNPEYLEEETEIGQGNAPGKRQGLMTMGPMALKPGTVHEIVVAYHYSYIPSASHYEQTIGTLQMTRKIQNLFDNCFMDLSTDCNALTEAPEQLLETGWNLFPNPAGNIATLSSKGTSFSRIQITDMLGRTVTELHLENPAQEYRIPLDDLLPGVYAVRADKQTLPLVVQR